MFRGVVAAIAAVMACAPAGASFTLECPTGCELDPEWQSMLQVDYTIPADGLRRLYTFELDGAGPAQFLVYQPNQTDRNTYTRTPTGIVSEYSDTHDFEFKVVVADKLTTIETYVPANFDKCATAAIGEVCARYTNIWGNGGFMFFTGTEPMILTTSVRVLAAVPEPASWALLIGGFAIMGAALRSKSGQERGPLFLPRG